ncbi:MAG TPA: hypothetical protein VLA66_00975 [Thermoanaerobaculia bacterium]|nr:hypothetical protein [Thermoanaerobaculia bacterium]
MSARARVVLVWVLAIVVTLVAAVWQRTTGPTYPARGKVAVGGETVRYRLARSHVTGSDQPVRVAAGSEVSGEILWRRYPTREAWASVPMRREGAELVGELPSQPAAGKLEYRVVLSAAGDRAEIPPEPAVTRFRGAVPAPILLPHILAMFLGMLFSNAAGFSALLGRAGARRQGWAALVLMAIGGLLLGPAVQKYAFDAWWTGFPFGTDLTDNKTAIALAAWALALWAARGGRRARVALAAAALTTLVVFAIPHSLFGSELRWEEGQAAPAPPVAPPTTG